MAGTSGWVTVSDNHVKRDARSRLSQHAGFGLNSTAKFKVLAEYRQYCPRLFISTDRMVTMLHDLFIAGVVGLFILLMVTSVFFLLMSLGE